MGVFSNLTNNTGIPIQNGQILSGASGVTGVTILNVVSGSTGTTALCEVSNVSAQTFNFQVINPPIQVTQVSNNVLTGNTIINGQFLSGDVVILSQ
ncbi:MAG: hypothetical protein ACKPKO_62460, partial [Candidatus Fonsibacter sp.]